jgi:hypothetical protein
MDERGDALVIALAVGDELVFTMPLANGEFDTSQTLGALGHRAETTLGEVMREAVIVQPIARQPLLAS